MILHGSGPLSVPVRNMLFCRRRLSEKRYCSARGKSDSDRALLALQSYRFRTVSVFKAAEISNKWWKRAVFIYFSCGNWERKLVVSLDIFATVLGRGRKFEMQRFGKKTRSKAFVLTEITSKYWTCRKTGCSIFCPKTYHLGKQCFLSLTSSKETSQTLIRFLSTRCVLLDT